MRSTAEMCRSAWWGFAVAGIASIAAAFLSLLLPDWEPRPAGVALLAGGAALAAALARSPAERAAATPFMGAAAGGIVLGLITLALPSAGRGISLVSVGIWTVLAGAGFLAVARLAAAYRVPDGGLSVVAWATLVAGVGISVPPMFSLGDWPWASVLALAVSGALAVVASRRLRVIPDEPPRVLSNRERRRRSRGAARG